MLQLSTRGSPIRKTRSALKSSTVNYPRKLRPVQERHTPASKSGNSRRGLACTQRDVFDWYETHDYKDDGGEIFSLGWQDRLMEWENEFSNQDRTELNQAIASYKGKPAGLSLGLLFQTHPVTAFSLWHLLQACYRLDELVCGKSMKERIEIAEWRKWHPFEYLLSTDIISTWEHNLLMFSSKVRQCKDRIEKEAFASRLDALAQGIESLEEARSVLVSVLGREGDDMPSYWMLGRIEEGVQNRCHAIEGILTRNEFLE